MRQIAVKQLTRRYARTAAQRSSLSWPAGDSPGANSAAETPSRRPRAQLCGAFAGLGAPLTSLFHATNANSSTSCTRRQSRGLAPFGAVATFRTKSSFPQSNGFRKPFSLRSGHRFFACFEPSPRHDGRARRKKWTARRVHVVLATATSPIVSKSLIPLASTTFHANLSTWTRSAQCLSRTVLPAHSRRVARVLLVRALRT
jgi:hypothetical protein